MHSNLAYGQFFVKGSSAGCWENYCRSFCSLAYKEIINHSHLMKIGKGHFKPKSSEKSHQRETKELGESEKRKKCIYIYIYISTARVRTQEQHTAPDNYRRNHREKHLGLPSALHQRHLASVLGDRRDVDREAADQARETHAPEDEAQRQREPAFERGRRRPQVERHHDRRGHHRQIDAQTQPGQERALVGEVVACVRRAVLEDQGAEKGSGEKEWPAIRGMACFQCQFCLILCSSG